MKVNILQSVAGDWEGLFINGELIDEAHTLGGGNSFIYILGMSEKYGFKSQDIAISELDDYDECELVKSGNFPNKISLLNGNY